MLLARLRALPRKSRRTRPTTTQHAHQPGRGAGWRAGNAPRRPFACRSHRPARRPPRATPGRPPTRRSAPQSVATQPPGQCQSGGLSVPGGAGHKSSGGGGRLSTAEQRRRAGADLRAVLGAVPPARLPRPAGAERAEQVREEALRGLDPPPGFQRGARRPPVLVAGQRCYWVGRRHTAVTPIIGTTAVHVLIVSDNGHLSNGHLAFSIRCTAVTQLNLGKFICSGISGDEERYLM